MRNFFLLVAIAGILLAFAPPAEIYKVDLNRSKVEWIGRKVTGSHHGAIKLSAGQLNVANQKLEGGTLQIDMTSMSNADLSGLDATKLLGHLKSDDFFSTDKNPISKFEITKVTQQGAEKAIITGNLTIKGISNPITFPASVKLKNGVLVAVANGIKVNRTKYEIKYGSNSFISGLGDKAIDDDFELNVSVVARK